MKIGRTEKIWLASVLFFCHSALIAIPGLCNQLLSIFFV